MGGCFGKNDNNIYVILPYFNFCKYNNRKRLFIEFIERMKHVKGIKLVVAEGILRGDSTDLPAKIPGVFQHHVFRYDHVFWLKENLINMAVRRLPDTWRHMAWIDADLTFVNDNWVQDTIKAFNKYDVVYLWETCINLGENKEAVDKPDKSFGYMHVSSGHPYHPKAKYGFWHPGYAVACTRKAFEKMCGLIDFAILGSGDRHMALALIGKVEWSAPGNIHEGYLIRLKAFQDRCKGLTLGYVPGTIIHHWHGDKVNRKYVERWDILTKNKYNPQLDIKRGTDGLIGYTHDGLRLQTQILQYFKGRLEDGAPGQTTCKSTI
jgi:hypothetical protein